MIAMHDLFVIDVTICFQFVGSSQFLMRSLAIHDGAVFQILSRVTDLSCCISVAYPCAYMLLLSTISTVVLYQKKGFPQHVPAYSKHVVR